MGSLPNSFFPRAPIGPLCIPCGSGIGALRADFPPMNYSTHLSRAMHGTHGSQGVATCAAESGKLVPQPVKAKSARPQDVLDMIGNVCRSDLEEA